MRSIIVADLHLSGYSNETLIDGIPEKLYYIMKTLYNITKYATEQKISNIIIAGDLMHTKAIIHSIAQSNLLDWIRTNKDIKFQIIDGNHDCSSKSGNGVSALKCLDHEPNVDVFHETIAAEKFYFVPWHPDHMVNDIRKGPKNKILIGHLGVSEGKLNSGISIVSDISLRDFSHYPICFLGHYHKPQELKNVVYVGSPAILDFGEKDDIKRFIVFDDETSEWTSVPSVGYKKYIDYIVDENTNIKELLEMANKEKENGNDVRILKTANVDLKQLEKNNFKIIDRQEVEYKPRGINSSMPLKDKMIKYLEIKDIPKDLIERYIEVGIEISNME